MKWDFETGIGPAAEISVAMVSSEGDQRLASDICAEFSRVMEATGTPEAWIRLAQGAQRVDIRATLSEHEGRGFLKLTGVVLDARDAEKQEFCPERARATVRTDKPDEQVLRTLLRTLLLAERPLVVDPENRITAISLGRALAILPRAVRSMLSYQIQAREAWHGAEPDRLLVFARNQYRIGRRLLVFGVPPSVEAFGTEAMDVERRAQYVIDTLASSAELEDVVRFLDQHKDFAGLTVAQGVRQASSLFSSVARSRKLNLIRSRPNREEAVLLIRETVSESDPRFGAVLLDALLDQLLEHDDPSAGEALFRLAQIGPVQHATATQLLRRIDQLHKQRVGGLVDRVLQFDPGPNLGDPDFAAEVLLRACQKDDIDLWRRWLRAGLQVFESLDAKVSPQDYLLNATVAAARQQWPAVLEALHGFSHQPTINRAVTALDPIELLSIAMPSDPSATECWDLVRRGYRVTPRPEAGAVAWPFRNRAIATRRDALLSLLAIDRAILAESAGGTPGLGDQLAAILRFAINDEILLGPSLEFLLHPERGPLLTDRLLEAAEMLQSVGDHANQLVASICLVAALHSFSSAQFPVYVQKLYTFELVAHPRLLELADSVLVPIAANERAYSWTRSMLRYFGQPFPDAIVQRLDELTQLRGWSSMEQLIDHRNGWLSRASVREHLARIRSIDPSAMPPKYRIVARSSSARGLFAMISHLLRPALDRLGRFASRGSHSARD